MIAQELFLELRELIQRNDNEHLEIFDYLYYGYLNEKEPFQMIAIKGFFLACFAICSCVFNEKALKDRDKAFQILEQIGKIINV